MLDDTIIFRLLTASKKNFAIMSALELGQKFSSIIVAKQTVNEYIVYPEWSNHPDKKFQIIANQ